MENGDSYYGAFIKDLDEICHQSIVRIRSYSVQDESKRLSKTGVVIASTDRSCFIITSNKGFFGNEVIFHDGTSKLCDPKYVRINREFKLAVIPIFDHGNVHWKTADISENEVTPNQKVFTCGFNSDTTTNFISGSSVSYVGVVNEDSQSVTAFVHSCSCGLCGHEGSAVFNEKRQLVGVNFSYKITQGVDYVSESSLKSHVYGGLVSALNLAAIKCGLASIYPGTKDMNLQTTVQYLRRVLTIRESKIPAGCT